MTPDPAAPDQPLSVMWDLGGAAAQMMLVAWELGIGSCPATVYEQALAQELLGYPTGMWCEYVLSFGYPADPSKLTAPEPARRAAGRWTRSSSGSAGRTLEGATWTPRVSRRGGDRLRRVVTGQRDLNAASGAA